MLGKKMSHSHIDEQGKMVKCYHECKSLFLSYSFWIATLIAFPLEHAIWVYLPPFKYIATWFGL